MKLVAMPVVFALIFAGALILGGYLFKVPAVQQNFTVVQEKPVQGKSAEKVAEIPTPDISGKREPVMDEEVKVALSGITEEELRDNVRFISHRNFAGRGTLNDEYQLISLFLERELREYGLAPFGNLAKASYLQDFIFTADELKTELNPPVLLGRNVLSYIEGEKKNEVVIIGAHYDHVGFGAYGSNDSEPKGKIHHGADDNASGTSAVLEIAEALGELSRRGIKPKRSIIIGFWGAEELGMIGSRYFIRNLPAGLKMENIAAYINLDMVGRNDDVIPLTTSGAHEEGGVPDQCPEVVKIIKEINKKFSLGFEFFFVGHSDRTDSYSFYEYSGGSIVSIGYFSGFHVDYHRPSDTWEKINYPKLTRVTKLAFLTLWEISEMKEKPRYR